MGRATLARPCGMRCVGEVRSGLVQCGESVCRCVRCRSGRPARARRQLVQAQLPLVRPWADVAGCGALRRPRVRRQGPVLSHPCAAGSLPRLRA